MRYAGAVFLLAALLPAEASASGTGATTMTALGVTRGVLYGAIAIAVGAFVFLYGCWRPAVGRTRSRGSLAAAGEERASALWRAAAVAGFGSALLGLLLQGALTEGRSLWSAVIAPGTVGAALEGRYGTSWLVAAALWPLVALLARVRAGASSAAALAIALVTLCAVPALGSHPASSWVTLPLSAVYTAALATWLGGAVALLSTLSGAAGAGRERLTGLARARYARLAIAALAVTLAAALAQGMISLSAPGQLTQTTYGRAFVVQLVLFAGLLGWLLARRRRPGSGGVRLLRVPVLIGFGLLAVTSALVGAPPARVVAAPAQAAGALGPTRAELDVAPGWEGPNQLLLHLIDPITGYPSDRDYSEMRATLTNAGTPSYRLDIPLARAARGEYESSGFWLPRAGAWTIRLSGRVADSDRLAAELRIAAK